MAPKIIAAISTFLINIAAGVVIFFMMLVAMNGFSGSDAEYGLGVYIVLAVLISILMSLGAFLLSGRLLKKQSSSVISTLIAIAVFAIVGIVLKIVSSLIGVGVVEYVRVNY
ncbi:MAG: hypothetical protein ABL959_06255 [Pyrinomonadaceae bacterium]